MPGAGSVPGSGAPPRATPNHTRRPTPAVVKKGGAVGDDRVRPHAVGDELRDASGVAEDDPGERDDHESRDEQLKDRAPTDRQVNIENGRVNTRSSSALAGTPGPERDDAQRDEGDDDAETGA